MCCDDETGDGGLAGSTDARNAKSTLFNPSVHNVNVIEIVERED
jgi:hypothetical protein